MLPLSISTEIENHLKVNEGIVNREQCGFPEGISDYITSNEVRYCRLTYFRVFTFIIFTYFFGKSSFGY